MERLNVVQSAIELDKFFVVHVVEIFMHTQHIPIEIMSNDTGITIIIIIILFFSFAFRGVIGIGVFWLPLSPCTESQGNFFASSLAFVTVRIESLFSIYLI